MNPRVVCLAAALALAGCSGTQVFPVVHEQVVSLKKGELDAGGVAFVTPSTVTGQEQEKQAVALTFADVMKKERPAMRVITLAETLGAINRSSGLPDAYKRMYDDYRDTGLLASDVLRRLGESTGARYIAQLKLQGFGQNAKTRWGILGFRVIETQYADVRIFLQIWDSRDGTIAWEAMQELRISTEALSEEPVTLRTLLEHTARDMLARLP